MLLAVACLCAEMRRFLMSDMDLLESQRGEYCGQNIIIFFEANTLSDEIPNVLILLYWIIAYWQLTSYHCPAPGFCKKEKLYKNHYL